MKTISRTFSIITGKKTLEHLYTIPDFPVFMGCVDNNNFKKDKRADMVFDICKKSGLIQLRNLLPLDSVYLSQHSEGIGETWEKHYEKFSKFIGKYKPESVLEIGGGNGVLAKKYVKENKNAKWVMIEPHPLIETTKNIKIIKKWFDEKTKLDFKPEAIVYSHVFEHVYFPNAFLNKVNSSLPVRGKLIFSIPNMLEFLSSKNPSCLNFEHTYFITEYFADYLLEKHGFKIIKKEYFEKHSIFYTAEKINEGKNNLNFKSKYKEYKSLFNDFIKFHEKEIAYFNREMEKFDETYVFGAYIFSQFLLAMGLSGKILAVLDNSKIKIGKRLYGTNLYVESPRILKGKTNAAVVLRAGGYQKEIKKQIKKINKKVKILE